MMDLRFIIPGFSKCGTTSLCALLDEHPDIQISKNKEPCFFSRVNYREDQEWFENLFDFEAGATVYGEGSTFYSNVRDEKVSRRSILEAYPGIKLIFIARDPVSRIESSYREFHNSGPVFGFNVPFGLGTLMDEFTDIVEDTCYWSRINNYKEFFPEEQIHVLFQEDLDRQPEIELARCFEFLDVDPKIKVKDFDMRLNEGNAKMYDTSFLRFLRANRMSRPLVEMVPPKKENKIIGRIGLRRKFKKPILWDDRANEVFQTRVSADTYQFLEYYQKPADFWGKLFEKAPPDTFNRTSESATC